MVRYKDFCGENVSYGFFGREGGVSTGVFASLNCKAGAGDDDEAVRENRSRVASSLGLPGAKVLTLDQVHGAHCLNVAGSLPQGAQGDALVTATPGVIIGVLTADCAPVLLIGERADGAPVIGAAHAGWGGAVRGIIEATIAGMIIEGADPSTLRAAIGPCIAQASYEVSAGFDAPLLADAPESRLFFADAGNGKLRFDLPSYVKFRLNRAGVKRVTVGGEDTYSDEGRWFSFRRSTHRNETHYGRQISVICIRNS